ncbi:MAG TPA: undecaprenyl-diphosphate phosphatase [Candidatus Hydrogenedentes bacterium]|nr:undecaprenyl-diphosphate phosphatase [Candidatus Hydrogenedentota bacterium]
MDFINAIVLAIVEGITEFLPISSTGHMILVEEYLKLGNDPVFADTFMVAIQLPAILSVVLYFWKELWPFGKNTETKPVLLLWTKVVAAFLPAAVLGFLLDDLIEAWLFNSVTVSLALIIGGIFLIVLERRKQTPRFSHVSEVSYVIAVGIGFIQCLAMIPGTSRSAATIIGAMLLGASRSAAAEFSFFLAIPTMLGATTFTLMETGFHFTGNQWALLAVGSIVSFLVAYVVVAWLMTFIRKHSFIVFGYYRIILGAIVLLLMLLAPAMR